MNIPVLSAFSKSFKMGIRALGFLPIRSKEQQNEFMIKLKDELFKLGAFGFEEWNAQVSLYHREGTEMKLIKFGDSNETIVVKDDLFLTADSVFQTLLPDLRLTKNVFAEMIGRMAQLGDFKIRYGSIARENKQTCGIILDIEYLPTQLLSGDFTMLFQSVVGLMTKEYVKLYTPEVDEDSEARGETYSFVHLGKEYMKLLIDACT